MSVSRRDLFKLAAPAALIIPCVGLASEESSAKDRNSKLDIFIIYGQSNALGFAGLDKNFSEDNLVKINSGSYYYFDGEIRPLVHYIPSVNTGISSGSAWSQFSNTYKQITGRSCVFIQSSRGATKLEDLAPPSNNYKRMISATHDVISILGDKSSGKVYCLFHQGEADQFVGTGKSKYKEMLLSLANEMKKEVNLDRFYLFKVAAPHGRSEEEIIAIQSAQDDLCETEELIVMAFSGCPSFNNENLLLGSDNVHYSIFGYNVMGQIGAENVAKSIETKTTLTKDDIEKYGFLSLNPEYDWRVVSASFTFNSNDGFKMLSNYYPSDGAGLYALSNVVGYETKNGKLNIKPSFDFKKILSANSMFNMFDRSFTARAIMDCDKKTGINVTAYCDICFDLKIGETTVYRPFTDDIYKEIANLIQLTSVKSTGEITIKHPLSGMIPNILIGRQGMYNKSLGYDIEVHDNATFSIKPFIRTLGTRISISISNCEVPMTELRFEDMVINVQVIAA